MGISPVNTGNADESATASDVNVLQPERSVKPLIHGENGNSVVSELPSGTVTRDVSNSLASWTEEEQTKVRAALEEKDIATEDIDKWMQNVNGIASMVAADRQRLDFEADETKSMAKPNADDGASIDASTLCAKRLLYQGVIPLWLSGRRCRPR